MLRPAVRTAARLVAVAAVSVVTAGILAVPAASAATTTNGVRLSTFESRLLQRINGVRLNLGKRSLVVTPGTTDLARKWAWRQAADNTLAHNPALRTGIERHGSADWLRFAENVGVTSESGTATSTRLADRLFDAYMASPAHRANILDPYVRYIGVGVVGRPVSGTVRYYNTLNFVDRYSTTYGPTRVPAWGLRSEARHFTTGSWAKIAGFEYGRDQRVRPTVQGSGLRVSNVATDAPRTGRDDALRFTSSATTSTARGVAGVALRDSLHLGGAARIGLRLAQSNPTGKAVAVRVTAVEPWSGAPSVTLGTIKVLPGAARLYVLTFPASARVFRSALTIGVPADALAGLSGSLSERRARVAVHSVTVNP